MIQDIEPHFFDNQYSQVEPQDNSLILFFNSNRLAIHEKTPDESINKITIEFPQYKSVKNYIESYTYLFAIDGISYFRVYVEDDKIETLKSIGLVFKNRHYFRMTAPKESAFASLTALHLNGWYEINRFCGKCGHKMVHDSNLRMVKCTKCGNEVFPKIAPAVIVAIVDNNRILLTKYRGRQYKNYALVAGFNEIGESLEETVKREVKEEVGLKVKNIQYYKSQPWGMADNILAGFICELDGSDNIIRDENELSVAEWVNIETINADEIDTISLTMDMIKHIVLAKKGV
ncbi:NAD(+) diphosphatase [Lachnobacterium bovis]|uniref:NAD(+) diphosphatase n=1 Tax=Lachnobacterium bovis TaxID=140626 RepID=UPI0004880C4A|nr:NAD(+) diphosphatase [Lachnobacterium bovis]